MSGSSGSAVDPYFCPYCAGAVLRGDYSQGLVASAFSESTREELQARRAQKEIQQAAYEAAKPASQRWLALRREWSQAFLETAVTKTHATRAEEQNAQWTTGSSDVHDSDEERAVGTMACFATSAE